MHPQPCHPPVDATLIVSFHCLAQRFQVVITIEIEDHIFTEQGKEIRHPFITLKVVHNNFSLSKQCHIFWHAYKLGQENYICSEIVSKLRTDLLKGYEIPEKSC